MERSKYNIVIYRNFDTIHQVEMQGSLDEAAKYRDDLFKTFCTGSGAGATGVEIIEIK